MDLSPGVRGFLYIDERSAVGSDWGTEETHGVVVRRGGAGGKI